VYETWSLTLREEHRLRVFLRTTFVSKMEEVTGGWRKSKKMLHNFYFSKNIIGVIK
jgi:hypothetical protein